MIVIHVMTTVPRLDAIEWLAPGVLAAPWWKVL
jgi:hypothetical protein